MLDGPLLPLLPLPLPLPPPLLPLLLPLLPMLARLALPIGPVDRLLRHGGSSGCRQLLDYKSNKAREL